MSNMYEYKSVTETVKRMLIEYPTLFTNRADALYQMFMTNGGGYDLVETDQGFILLELRDLMGEPDDFDYDAEVAERIRYYEEHNMGRQLAIYQWTLKNIDEVCEPQGSISDDASPYKQCPSKYSCIYKLKTWVEEGYYKKLAPEYKKAFLEIMQGMRQHIRGMLTERYLNKELIEDFIVMTDYLIEELTEARQSTALEKVEKLIKRDEDALRKCIEETKAEKLKQQQ